MKKSINRARSFFPLLEHLEDRLAPAVVEAYPGAPFPTPYNNFEVAGQHNLDAFYIDPNGNQKMVVEDPITSISVKDSNFATATADLVKAGWKFTVKDADAANPPITLTVQSYNIVANSTKLVAPTPQGTTVEAYGGNTKVDIFVKTSAVKPPPPALPPVPGNWTYGKWIQVVTTNFPTSAKEVAATDVTFLDTGGNANTPFYPADDERGFLDSAWRINTKGDVEWHAQLFYVVQTSFKEVTVYQSGITWGWSTITRSSPYLPPTLSLTSDVNTVHLNGLVDFTVNVGTQGFLGPPTGTIVFVDVTNQKLMGTAELYPEANGGATAVLHEYQFPTAGVRTVQATYDGDVNYLGVRATLAQTVNMAKAQLQFNPEADAVALGAPATFSVAASDLGPSDPVAPTGEVDFYDGATPVGTSTLDATGHATFMTSSLTLGSHTITAVYGGDQNFTAADPASATEVIDSRTATTTTLSLSTSTSLPGQQVDITALIWPATSGVAPSGNVELFVDGTLFGLALVSVGSTGEYQSRFSTSQPALGQHTFRALYQGDATYDPSKSSSLTETVQPPPPTVSVSAEYPFVYAGQAVTFSASVSLTGGVTPTGPVYFYDGTTLLGSSTLSPGGRGALAAFTTSNLALGSHSITAVYGGDSRYGSSTSSPVSENVVAALYAFHYAYGNGDGAGYDGTVADDGTFGYHVGEVVQAGTSGLGGQGAYTITAVAGTTSAAAGTVYTSNYTDSSGEHYATADGLTGLASGTGGLGSEADGYTDATSNGSFWFDHFSEGNAFEMQLGAVANVDGFDLSQCSLGQIVGLFNGTITNYAEVGGPDVPVVRVFRTDGCAETALLNQFGLANGGSPLVAGTPVNPNGGEIAANGAMSELNTVVNTPGALGYVDAALAAAFGLTAVPLPQNATSPFTTLALSSSAPVAASGATVTFTATLSNADGLPPTGTVSFYDGATLLGSVALDGSGGPATYTTSALGLGAHHITAVYSGDWLDLVSSASLNQNIGTAAP